MARFVDAKPLDIGVVGPEAPRQAPSHEGLILFSYPLLVDEGRLSVGANALKEALEEPAFVEVHTSDAERLGLRSGVPARVRTQSGETALTVRVSEHVAPGSVFVPWNQPGFAANTLLSGSMTTEVTLEPASAEVSA